MEKKKGKFDFKLMTSLGKLNDEQFKVMFFILNTINLNGGNRTKIYRAVLADICGKSERTISRITDKLAEQGLIVKDSVSDGSKLYNYYALPMTKNKEKVDNEKQKTESISVIDDRVNTSNTIKTINKNNTINNNNTINTIKNNNIEKQFEIDKEILLNKIEEATDGLDFNAIESVKIPLNEFITSTFSNEIDRLKRILYNTLEKKKENLKETLLEEAMSLSSTEDNYPF